MSGQQNYKASLGEYLVLPAGAEIDVNNLPDRHTRQFACAVLIFDAETIDLFSKLYGDQLSDWRMQPQWKARASEALYSAVADWLAHSQAFGADLVQTRHRMVELLLLVARQGVAGNLLFQKQASLGQKIKHMFALDPSRNWRVVDMTTQLGASESTLRRRLHAEGKQFRDLLEEARLDHGIDLVMATDMPISQIAFHCGYQSQSRFAERFRLRYSLSPTELRATQSETADTAGVIPLSQRRHAV
ncbi:helix-turn-helix transcriptional regulator [Ruegeria sp. MALMAid1280]|uniref:helix-turn-helix transcriptional regulator n=1 Tax=Ruegeria sp. MALMAid1280 TaxID=3411634 RepID=UPI003B9F6C31